MKITQLEISEDKDKLLLTIDDATAVSELKLWTQDTYKNFSEAIDLADKLTGAGVDSIEITLNDIGISEFDGIYFIEAEDPDEISLEYTYNIDSYKECMIQLAAELTICNDCFKSVSERINKIQLLYDTLVYSLELRRINEIVQLYNAIKQFCSNKCNSCGPATKVVSKETKENLNPDTFNIIVDGGEIE